MNLNNVRNKLERFHGQYLSIREQIKQHAEQKEKAEKCIRVLEKAQIIIQEVSKATQEEVEFHVSDLVSHGLAAVFNDPYIYKLAYVLRRDKTEADQTWTRRGSNYLPNGGGVRDVSAFALHIACIMLSLLQKQGVRPVLFLDEPTKHLVPNKLQERFGMMLQAISKNLNIQIILISHNETLYSCMNKKYRVAIQKGVSHVSKED